jgi:hypothetical protein
MRSWWLASWRRRSRSICSASHAIEWWRAGWTAMPEARHHSWQDRAELALFPLGLAAYLVLPYGIGYGDAFLRYGTLDALMSGEISPIRYSIVQALLAVPFHLAGQTIDYPRGIVARFNLSVFLAGLAAMALLLRGRVPNRMLRRLLLLLLASSMFVQHVQGFYGEVITAVFAAVGLLCLVAGPRWAGYPLLIIGVVNTPAALPALFLALLVRPGPHRLWNAVWPCALAAALVMLEFYVRRGSPFSTGYEGDHGFVTPMPYSGRAGFAHPLVFGVLAILFSFGKGLALFVPGLWLLFKRPAMPAPEALRLLQRLSIAFLVGLILVYAKWWAWNGAWFWGPRFLLFASVPGAVGLAIHLCDAHATTGAKALTLAALCWSTWVAISGIAIGLADLDVCTANHYNLEALCWYTVEFSPLFHPFIVTPRVEPRYLVGALYVLLAGVVLAAPFTSDLVQAGLKRRSRIA